MPGKLVAQVLAHRQDGVIQIELTEQVLEVGAKCPRNNHAGLGRLSIGIKLNLRQIRRLGRLVFVIFFLARDATIPGASIISLAY